MKTEQEIQNTIKDELLKWWTESTQQGLSSKSLARAAIEKLDGKRIDYPYDNSDFRRCVNFKNECPTAFEAAKKAIIEQGHYIWTDYFNEWDRMEALLNGQIKGENNGDALYKLMLDIRAKEGIRTV